MYPTAVFTVHIHQVPGSLHTGLFHGWLLLHRVSLRILDVPATTLAEMVRTGNKDFVWYLEVSKKRPLASRTKTRNRKLHREEAQLICRAALLQR